MVQNVKDTEGCAMKSLSLILVTGHTVFVPGSSQC